MSAEDEHARAELERASREVEAFERHLRATLEDHLLDRSWPLGLSSSIWVIEVSFQGRFPDTEIVYVLEDDRLPGCRLGWNAGGVWTTDTFTYVEPTNLDGSIWWLYLPLEENVLAEWYGMPVRCAPGPITWIHPHEVDIDEAVERAPFGVAIPTWLPFEVERKVIFEDRRRNFPFCSVELIYEFHNGLLHVLQAEGFRFRIPEEGWVVETVDGWAIGVRRWKMHPTGLDSWSALIRWPDVSVLLESDVLNRDEMLRIARSLEDLVID